ncbi:hypothetical protein [Alteromonas lipolytica]|uniref:Uncharacterized protein n=1 Tax=Alteromonas lipolytica TaxID=1856405 RepID=A0A1E8FA87_9ALTE|nr:hypothetical protein [Alteromonas lipolytica]OFI32696.1 hypothetical protein BFC17_05955 [Alteromonas lipolytica]GGF74009.1 hypothetical protein GCM10011338_27540 [Alteromonas lipolytica]
MKKLSILALFIGVSCGVNAAEVESADVTTFVSGTPATAADVNSTIAALVTAINDNAVTIAQLQSTLNSQASRIAALETAVESLKSADSAFTLAGSTYRVGYIGAGHNYSSDTGYGASDSYGGNALVTFNDGGVLDITELTELEQELSFDLYCSDQADSSTCSRNLQDYSDAGSISGTWSLSGNEISITLEGETETWYVSDNGDVILAKDTTDILQEGTSSAFWANLSIGVKVSQ